MALQKQRVAAGSTYEVWITFDDETRLRDVVDVEVVNLTGERAPYFEVKETGKHAKIRMHADNVERMTAKLVKKRYFLGDHGKGNPGGTPGNFNIRTGD
jgi:hypothetical protein